MFIKNGAQTEFVKRSALLGMLLGVVSMRAEVIIVPQETEWKISAAGYQAKIGKDGCLSNLMIDGLEFLAPGVNISRGSYFWQGSVLSLNSPTKPSDAVLAAENERASILYAFFDDHMTWTVTNKTQAAMTFLMVFNAKVDKVAGPDGQFIPVPITAPWTQSTWRQGDSTLVVSGGTRIWGPWGNTEILQVDLAAGETRKLELKTGKAGKTEELNHRVTAADSGPPRIADPTLYLRPISDLLKEKWPRNRSVRIVCHGHSVPSGYAATPFVDTFNAYPYLLHKGLKEQFPYAVINVIVTAIGGENAMTGSTRFERDVLSLRPDVVMIDYALNDRHIGLAKARLSWISMIEKAQAAGIKVILLTPTGDTGAKLDDPNDPLNQHAQQIRDLAAIYHVGLVDSLAAFKKAMTSGQKLKELMSTGNHPNRKGHDLVRDELMKWFPQ